jgi:CubicO group peptidase (beta-lactamase class C family)
VLTHTAGFPADDGPGTDWWEHEDRVGAVLEAGEGPSDPPVFAYSSGGSHLLAAVLAEATGEPVLDHVGRTVLDPLGVPRRPAFQPRVPHDIDDEAYADLYDEYMSAGFAWPRDPQGVHDGGCCMRLRAVDLLALGRLYLHEGRAGGRQVLPAGWVQASTGAHVDTRDFFPGYGYQWWVGDADDHDAFVAYGYGGQMIEVLPDLDTVVVVMTEVDDRDPMIGTTLFGPGEATYMVELAVLPHVLGRDDGA